jgi:uncharacterized protein YndB with AHSA1/START domain
MTFRMLSDREYEMTRVFDAPRDLVFAAYTDPQQIPRWWGPRGVTTIVDTMDMRPGGTWRFIQRGADRAEYGFRGVYREVVPPERLVYTLVFEFAFPGKPDHDVLETLIFEEKRGLHPRRPEPGRFPDAGRQDEGPRHGTVCLVSGGDPRDRRADAGSDRGRRHRPARVRGRALRAARRRGVPGDLVGLPAARLAVLPGTTHVRMMARHEWLAPMVAEFLDAPLSEGQ